MAAVVLLRASRPCFSLPSYTCLLSVSARSPIFTTATTARTGQRISVMAANGVNGHVKGTRGKHDFASFKVNQDRLMKNIHDGCEFGAAWRYGKYVVAHEWFKTCGLT